jgi:sulfite reductase (NADPH) flavoprotein alpha-component
LTRDYITGNDAAAHVAYAASEVAFVYPFLSHDFLGESVLEWSEAKRKNALGEVVRAERMSTQDGAGGAAVGALSTGAMISVFSSSQGLPLMMANMYQIAHNRQACVFHVSAQRIHDDMNFTGDASEIMAVRQTGFSMLSSHSVQECHDLALVAHLASVACSAPFLHFFDGLRTSHETSEAYLVNDRDMKLLTEKVASKASTIPSFTGIPDMVEGVMTEVNEVLGTQYGLFEFIGAADAELVIVIMGAGTAVAEDTLAHLEQQNYKAGVLKVHLYRPWSPKHFLQALPNTVQRIAVVEDVDCDSALFSDVAMSFHSQFYAADTTPLISSGVFTLENEEFTPNMVKAIFYDLAGRHPTSHFSIGSGETDANYEPLPVQSALNIISEDTTQMLVLGSSSDDLVHSTKRALRVMGDHCNVYVQGHFTHDSYVGDGVVNAHVRFGPKKISSQYLIDSPDVILCTDVKLLSKYNILSLLKKQDAIFVLNSDWDLTKADTELVGHMKKQIAAAKCKFYTVNATELAEKSKVSVGSAMLAAFYKIAGEAGIIDPIDAAEMIGQNLKQSGNASASVPVHSLQYPRAAWRNAPAVGWAPVSFQSARGQSKMVIPTLVSGTARPVSSDRRGVAALQAASIDKKITTKHYPLDAARAKRCILFPKVFGGKQRLRMGSGEAHHISVSSSTRLTPTDYDRNIFHLEFDIGSSGLKYTMGDALAVHPSNTKTEVEELCAALELDPAQIWAVDKSDDDGDGKVEVLSVAQLFTQVLDIKGRPSKKFFKALAACATDAAQKKKLEHLVTDAGAAEYEGYGKETVSHAELLIEFTSARPAVHELVELIPRIKPRLYSIASSYNVDSTKVALLVVVEDWNTPAGKYKLGLCSDYLRGLKPGSAKEPVMVTASVKPSLMKLPKNASAPIVMAGTGTGMAPFRAFLQEKHHQRRNGTPIGETVLYFGARYSAKEFLYKEDLTGYKEDGTLTHFRPAWSRDTSKKVYIQHLIGEDAYLLWDLLVTKKGSFYLCGQAGKMPNDVYDAIVSGFVKAGGVTTEQAKQLIADAKEEGRYVLEVY